MTGNSSQMFKQNENFVWKYQFLPKISEKASRDPLDDFRLYIMAGSPTSNV
jgi:hypothetical protein